jgi:DNA-binding NtrC family response regulator
MTMKRRTALLVGASELWNYDLNPILKEMRFGVVSLEGISDIRDALQSDNYELVVVCSPFGGMTLVSSLDIEKSLAPDSQVLVLTDDMTERDLRDALISGSFVSANWPLGHRDMSAILSPADQGLLVHVRN